MSTLPPVPQNLRALAARQLATPATGNAKTLSLHLRRMGEYAKNMQWVILQRTKSSGTSAGVDGGWANGSDWQRLLAELDKAVAALRTAWKAVKDTNPVVQQILATWREQHGIAPGNDFHLFDSQDNVVLNEVWMLLIPQVQQAWGSMPQQVDEALGLWIAVLACYFHLLTTGKYVLGALTKARLLDECRQLHPTNRLAGPLAAAA